MQAQSPTERYGLIAQALHWLSALGVVTLFVLGLIMVDMAFSPQQLKLYSWHKWIGATLFALVVLRLAWRAWHPAPRLPVHTPLWQQRLAQITHWMLYALLLLIPITGWLMSSAKGFQTVVFGILPLPDAVAADEALGERLALLHWWLNKTLLALILLHVAAALKHHFIDRDGLLWRMLPARSRHGAP